jgi:hypothetical protein
VLPRGAFSSRAILVAIGALYTLVLLGLPLLYSRFSAAHSGDDNLAVTAARHSDLPQHLARVLSSRRMALEGGQLVAAMWPDPSGRLSAAAAAQLPRVEYRDAGELGQAVPMSLPSSLFLEQGTALLPGNVVSLADALNISQWDELPLYLASEWNLMRAC